ncbi:MAG TPA: hypothetical protein H9744_07710 [Candidatus Eisenbergiella stercoravium]|nr:hypothetical protein [Candidatus Eisenbergiella stercoravium]
MNPIMAGLKKKDKALKNMDIILDISKPIINFIPPVDMILSILGSEIDTMQNVIWENYIKVKCRKNFLYDSWIEFEGFSDWENFQTLEFQLLPRSFTGQEFRDLLIRALNDGNYVYYVHNTYYVSNYENFHKQHRDHEIFIYGYNLEEDLFYGADYFDYRTYRHQALKRKQLEEAYLYLNDMDYVGGILLIRKKTVGVDINYRKIKEGLESLLSGSWQRKESLDGLGFLGNMKNYILNSPDISIKLISFPYCHVKLMYHRVEAFLKTNRTFESSYRMMGDIVRDTLIFRNVILKEFCKSGSEPDIECRKKLALRLESIEEQYRYAIGGILKAIYQMEMETIPNR